MIEMTPGGVWLSTGGTGLSHYVINPDHIARLMLVGYQVIADPRIPADFDQPEKGIDTEDDTNGRLTAVGSRAVNKASARSVDTASG